MEFSDSKIMDETIDTADRLLELPPFIIHQIMSYIPAKELAQTSIISKRWNCFRKSFPVLDFDQESFLGVDFDFPWQIGTKSFYKRVNKFVKFVDSSVLRFCQLKSSMHKFRLYIDHVNVKTSSFVDKCIGLAVENEVKELDLNVITDQEEMKMYSLPRRVFCAKSVTILKLSNCKLDQPLDTIKLPSLRELTLERVFISKQMVQKLTSDCHSLVDLALKDCLGLTCYCISNAFNLKFLTIRAKINDFERIEIVVPSLEEFTLISSQRRRSFVVNMDGCPNLSLLNLFGTSFTDQEFYDLVSKFPLLKKLKVSGCPFLEREGDFETPWFLNLKDFLEKSNHLVHLSIDVIWKESTFNWDNFRESFPSLPCEVEKLHLCITDLPPSRFPALLDGLLGICHPWTLSVRAFGEEQCKFMEWLHEELKIKNKDASCCCSSYNIKCWRHYLQAVIDESFIPFKDGMPVNINSLTEVQPILAKGFLEFDLNWFDVPVERRMFV